MEVRNEPLTREKMAWLLYDAACNFMGDNKEMNNLDNLDAVINDIDNVGNRVFNTVADNKWGLSQNELTGRDANGVEHGEHWIMQQRIKRLYAIGLLKGDNNNNFNPQATLTRAEATAVVNRLFRYTDRIDTTALLNQYDVYFGKSREQIAKENSPEYKAAMEERDKRLNRTEEEKEADRKKWRRIVKKEKMQ